MDYIYTKFVLLLLSNKNFTELAKLTVQCVILHMLQYIKQMYLKLRIVEYCACYIFSTWEEDVLDISIIIRVGLITCC